MGGSDERGLLRHTLATLAYRGGKAVRGAPASFAGYQAAPGGRTPLQVLGHMGDLMDWALSVANGNETWQEHKPQEWEREVERFFAALGALDRRLAEKAPPAAPVDKLFQGPIADALTHVGQMAMLRRMAGAAIKGENYFRAEITVGRVGVDQAKPKREF